MPTVEVAIAPAVTTCEPGENLSAIAPVPPEDTNADLAVVLTAESVEAAETPPDLEQTWQTVIGQVQPFSTQVLMRQQCRLIAFDGKEAAIGVSSEKLIKMAQSKLSNMEAAFVKVFNVPIRISLQVVAIPLVPTSKPPTSMSRQIPPPTPRANQPETGTYHPITDASSPSTTPSPANSILPAPVESATSIDGDTVADSTTPNLYWQADDEVTRAAKKLAEFFNGKVVGAEDDLAVTLVLPTEQIGSETTSLEATPWDDADTEPELEDDENLPF